MTPPFDSYDEMHTHPVDEAAERLLSGRQSGPDGPGAHSGIDSLFEALRSPATPAELSGRSSIVAAMVAEVRELAPASGTTIPRRRRVLSKILTAKAAAAATVAVFGLGTAAAAASGSLPGQATSHANSHAHHGLATAASHAGKNHGQASHNDHTAGPAGTTGTSSSSTIPPTGPANTHAQYGLCQAFLSFQNTPTSSPSSLPSSSPSTSVPPQYRSTAFSALLGEHKGASGTTTYCQDLVKASSSGADSTDTNGSGDSGKPADAGKPSGVGHGPVSPGKPSTTPGSGKAPVSTPNSGGTHTADTASGGASSSGTSTANTASGGASLAGSGNAGTHP